MSQFIPLALPSRCKTYGEPVQELIKIRSFVGRDSEIIASINESNLFRKFAEVIDNTLQGYSAVKLTSGDAKYILLWQAINSYSGKIYSTVVCEHCFHEFSKEIDLDADLDAVFLPEDFDPDIVVTISSGEVHLRLLTLGDEIAVYDRLVAGQPSALYELALAIVNDKTVDENLEILRDMDIADINLIEKELLKYEHGPIMEAKYECTECKREGKIGIPFRIERFFSF